MPLDMQNDDEPLLQQVERLLEHFDTDRASTVRKVVARHARKIEREQMERMGTKRAHELHVAGELFGYTTKGDSVTLYIEDDTYWHPVASFHTLWLADLERVTRRMREHRAKCR